MIMSLTAGLLGSTPGAESLAGMGRFDPMRRAEEECGMWEKR
jgi:hypothetical protein